MAAPSELELVERVFLKIVLAESDDKFQAELNSFLTPVLLKLSTRNESVKNKILELLTHVNKRLKSRSSIQLPLGLLLQQFMDVSVPIIVQNFTIIYINMGFKRALKESRIKFIPKMFACLKGKPASHQNKLLLLILLNLNDIIYPENIIERKKLFAFLDDAATTQFVLDFFLDFLLLPYDLNIDMKNTSVQPPPSFSRNSFMRLQTDPLMTKEEVESAKLAILKFLCSDVMPSASILPHLVVASSDVKHLISDKGEHALRVNASSESWENKMVISKLLKLYQGTVLKPGDMSQAIATDSTKLPSSLRLKLKIFPCFLKSKITAEVNPAHCLQIIFEGLFGENTNQKIKYHAIELIHHIAFYGSNKTLSFMAPLFNQALSRVAFSKEEDVKLRVLALNGYPKLAKCCPAVIKKDVGIIERVLNTITENIPDIQTCSVSIISPIAEVFQGVTGKHQSVFESLLQKTMRMDEAQLRLGACRLAAAAFSSTHLLSRYALVNFASDRQENIREEALRALYPRKEFQSFPKYEDACYFFFDKAEKDGCTMLTMKQVLIFLQKCLYLNCGIEEDDLLDDVIVKLKNYFHSADLSCLHPDHFWKSFIGKHMMLLRQTMKPPADYSMYALSLDHLSIFFDVLPQTCLFFLENIKLFKSLLSSPKDEIRNSAAQVTSTLICAQDSKTVLHFTKELANEILKGENSSNSEGTILCIGYTISRFLELDNLDHEELKVVLSDILQCLMTKLDNQSSSLATACCTSIFEICRFIKLPFDKPKQEEMTMKLCEKFKGYTNVKLKESAGLAISSLCVGNPDFNFRDRVVDTLFEVAEKKQLELQFNIGECISLVGSGQSSKVFKRRYGNEIKLNVPNDEVMTSLLNRIFTKIIQSPLGHIRQAGVVWLMSIVKLCPTHSPVQHSMKDIQRAFMQCLCDTDEITQDVASRGLSLVYEMTEGEEKPEMIQLLMDSLMHGNKQKRQVDKDSKIFEDGALGVTPDGSKLSTYKELCSLATSMNKPDLMYKFMSLAHHNAIWNSKKGAAFGIKAIANIAGEEIKPYIGQMIPRLYRYQYDPNTSLKQSMSSIWSVIVGDDKKTVAKYWKEILQDLINNITSNIWRTRESCCLAMKDLLKVIPEGDLVEYLPGLWKLIFKVLDDIKESVRKAATSLVKSLSQLTVRLCDAQNLKVGEKAIGGVLEMMLSVGMTSPVEEVKSISIHTLVQIAKHGGKLLAKHVATFIPAMLDSLSGLEHQGLNTLSLQLSGQDQSAQDKLDNIRVSSANTSPMMEAVNLCLVSIDSTNLGELVPRLCTLLKSGLGISTKVGTSKFVTSLTLHCKQEMQPYSGKLLSQLLNGVKNSPNTIKSAYSATIGTLIKYAADTTAEKVMTKIQNWYIETEDRSINYSCALCTAGILRSSQEMFSKYGNLLVPLIFVAMQPEASFPLNSTERKYWSEMWEENSSGNKATIKLYMSEIYEFSQKCFQSPLWDLKLNAAKALEMIADTLDSSMSFTHAQQLIKLCNAIILGPKWAGKDLLMEVLRKLCIKNREVLRQNDDHSSLMKETFSVLLQQSNKRDLKYKLQAIDCLTQIAETWSEDLLQTLAPLLNQLSSSTEDDDDDDDDNEDDDMKENEEKRNVCVMTSLGRLSSNKNLEQVDNILYVVKMLSKFIDDPSLQIRDALFTAVTKVIERLPSEATDEDSKKLENISEFVRRILPMVIKTFENPAQKNLKMNGLKCLKAIYTKAKGTKFMRLGEFNESMQTQLQNLDPTSLELENLIGEVRKLISEIF